MGIKEKISEAKSRGLSKKEIKQWLLKKGFTESYIDEHLHTKPTKLSDKHLEPIEKIKLLINPQEFFRQVHEPTITNALAMYAIIAVLVAIIFAGFSFIMSGFESTSFFIIIPFFIASIIGTFLYTIISHVTLKIMKGRGSFTDSYNVVTYSLIPALLLSLIPFIGILAYAYSILLMTIGLSYNHNISKGKAVISALMPFILLFLLVVFFIGLVIVSFTNAF